MTRFSSPPSGPWVLDIDPSVERSDDYAVAGPKHGRRRTAIIIAGVILCLAAGSGAGFWLSKRFRVTEGQLVSENLAVDPFENQVQDTQETLMARLASIAMDEAHRVVQQGLDRADRTTGLLPSTGDPTPGLLPSTGDPTPGLLPSTAGQAGQAIDGPRPGDGDEQGRQGRTDGRSSSRERASTRSLQPVEMEFAPQSSGGDGRGHLEEQVKPLMDLDQYDPYGTSAP